MKPRELTAESFAATIIPPMRRLVGPGRPDILLDDYLRYCRAIYNPPDADHQFVELRCFISNDSRFVHVVYAFGPPENCLIMVLVLGLSENSILGHHFINPPELPADHACPVPKPAPPPHLTHPEAKELPNDE